MPPAGISLTLSRHFSLSFIASDRSSGLHPVSSQSCCVYVRAGRPAFARPYVGIHRSTSLMSSSLLLQQCPACLVRDDFHYIHYINFIMFNFSALSFSWFVLLRLGCALYTRTSYMLLNIARSILAQFPSSFFFIRLVSVHIEEMTRPLYIYIYIVIHRQICFVLSELISAARQ